MVSHTGLRSLRCAGCLPVKWNTLISSVYIWRRFRVALHAAVEMDEFIVRESRGVSCDGSNGHVDSKRYEI